METYDYSALSEFCWCPQSYRRRHLQHLVPVDRQVDPSLLFGNAIHEARASLAKDKDLDLALRIFDANYTALYEEEALTDFRTPYIGRSLVRAYHQKWGDPQDTYTEIGGATELDDFLVYGRIDYVERHLVVDVKTTSAIMWLPKPRLNWQLVGYAYMVGEITGQTPDEVGVDGVIVPRMAKKLIQSELPPEDEYALTLHEYLHRRTAPVLETDFEHWLAWVRWTVRQIRECIAQGYFPLRAPVACVRYNRRCDYEPLCLATSEEVAENMIFALYTESKWEPY